MIPDSGLLFWATLYIHVYGLLTIPYIYCVLFSSGVMIRFSMHKYLYYFALSLTNCSADIASSVSCRSCVLYEHRAAAAAVAWNAPYTDPAR